MPESRESLTQENRLSLESMDLPSDDYLHCEPEYPEDFGESRLNMSRDSAKSIESLNTLLMSMPEISIPPPVHNPLPLQCLAASALPAELKREIDVVIAEYALSAGCEPESDASCCQQAQLLLRQSAAAMSLDSQLESDAGQPGDHSATDLDDINFTTCTCDGVSGDDYLPVLCKSILHDCTYRFAFSSGIQI